MRQHYVAVVYKNGDNGFDVLFPDFPGVVVIAPTLDEAIKRAGKALALHAEGMLAKGKALPTPSSVSSVLANPDYRTAVLALIPLQLSGDH
jgi:predicted RNase H-like HicB family nuclease